MKKFLAFLLFILSFLFFSPILAQTVCDDPSLCINKDPLICKNEQISSCTQQLKNTQGKENTLKSQLTLIDGQTKVTILKIEETNLKIDKLKREISDLATRIDRISTSLDTLSEILLNRIVQTYKYSNAVSTFDLIFSSHGFAELLERLKYIQVAQAYDKKKLYELQATKISYNEQKQDKQTRQVEAEKLSKDLEIYQTELDSQKKQKNDLLRETQNDENKYQQLITKLRADADSLARALAGGGAKIGPVNKGDKIAVVGNSGCSSGSHLHMEVITSSHITKINDKNYIVDENNQPIKWGLDHREDPRPYIQSGRFPKPVAEYTDNDACSQDGGPYCHNGDISTRFKQSYFLGTHTGLDIADYFGAAIFAADNGDSYAFADSTACYLTGTVGKGVAIDHHNGMVTLYWHIP